MKQTIVLIAMILTVNTVFSQNWSALKGSGKLLNLSPTTIQFDKIETQLPGKVQIEIGQTQSVNIAIDDNLSDFLIIEQDDKEHKLTFKWDTKKMGKDTWIQENNILIRITIPGMSVFVQKSNGDAEISGLYGRYFRAENYGNGSIILRGPKVDLCDIESRGNGDVEASKLTATKAKVILKGNGLVRFNASETCEIDLKGNGSVENTGKGKASKIHQSGNGSVKSL